jgi:hypothetical protein
MNGGDGGGDGGGGGNGDTFNGEYSVLHRDERIAVFEYGSNSIEQIRMTCENPNLQSVRAKLHNFVRCFSGRSLNRQNGAVATVVPMANHVVLGSIVYLTQSEIEKLDVYEGVDSINYGNTQETRSCRRVNLQVVDCSEVGKETVVPAWVYVQNRTQWVPSGAHGGKPSPQYLTSMKKNIEQHWCQQGGTTITIRRADTGEIVEEWSGNFLTFLKNPVGRSVFFFKIFVN